MIKKLRRKIFWSIECSAAGVLFIILVVYNILQYIQYEQKEWQMLSSVMTAAEESINVRQSLDGDDGFKKNGLENGMLRNPGRGKGRGKGGRGTTEIVNNLISGEIGFAELNGDGTIVSVSGFLTEYEEEEKQQLLDGIQKKDKNKGFWGSMKYMYQCGRNYRLITVLDAGYVNKDIITLAAVSLFGLLVAGAFFAVIARKISKMIARPVEETLDAQKQFIADASHELKTPVAVIGANISVLEKEIGENRWMNYIKEEGKRLADLTKSLLLLSRIDYEQEDKQEKKENKTFHLTDAILETALPFESIAYEQGMDYTLQIPENVMFSGREEDIKKIVEILLDNALKHAGEKGKVTLELREKHQKKNFRGTQGIILTIQNTGAEIPKEILPCIFNRFYKADTAREYQENSFGLGLAIAKSLTERNGGEISVTSEKGLTVFTVWLPKADPSMSGRWGRFRSGSP